MSGTTSGRAKQATRSTARKADSPWVKTMGQVGVAAIGVVYLLLAWIALQVAFGGSSQSADNSGALKEIAEKPFGKVLLVVMALGLFSYALWQLILAIIGFQQKHGKERVFERIGAVARSVVGLVLGVQSIALVLGSGGGKSSSQKQEDWTAKLLGVSGGRILVVVVGLVVVGVSGLLIYDGVKKEFLDRLEGRPTKTVVRLGQAGWISRGLVFGLLGVLVVVAGVKSQPQKARGLDNALKTLADQPYGKWLLTVAALGLASYAVFQLVTARKHKSG